MKKVLWISLLLVFSTWLSAFSGSGFDYKSAWKRVQQLQFEGLPASMSVVLDSIYQAAEYDNKTDQQINALINQLAIIERIDGFRATRSIKKVQDQVKKASFPATAIMHSMLGQLYWDYYAKNRQRFQKRTLRQDFDRDDLATWDLKTLHREAISEFRLSLERSSDLKQLKLSDFSELWRYGGKEEIALRPTLYDFLAHRALDFYRCDEASLTIPKERFSLKDPRYFDPAETFMNMKISTTDTLSLKYQAILIFLDLIRFHSQDEDPAPLVEVDLQRLEFVNIYSGLNDGDVLYEESLRKLRKKYEGQEVWALATFKLALFVQKMGNRYRGETAEDYRWYYEIADKLAREGNVAFPESFGGKSCSALSRNIRLPAMRLNAESHIVPDTPFLVHLSVQNIRQVRIHIYRMPYPALTSRDVRLQIWQARIEEINKKFETDPFWGKTFSIADEEDFRTQFYELPVDPLPAGRYLVIASDFNRIKQTAIINCTDIYYTEPESWNGIMRVTSRKTGLPLTGAEAQVHYTEARDDAGNRKSVLKGTALVDSNGFVDIKMDNLNWRHKLIFTNGADTLMTTRSIDIQNRLNIEGYRERFLLFTDRAIYRPGQTVYLKGVFFSTKASKETGLLSNRKITAKLEDTKYKVITQKNLVTNEYGTFNCSFTLPLNAQSGTFYVSAINRSYGSVSIEVEEYKRPTFEVKLDDPEDSYRLHQNVSLNGTALTYAGFPVDNAMVSYRVARQVKYPFWRWWWGELPAPDELDIDFGTTKTDSEGRFSLSFDAIADRELNSRHNPYFIFVVHVDVTDIGGETRSGKLELKAGYRELILDAEIEAQVDIQKKELSLPIIATNLSGKNIPIKGKATIYKLQDPGHIIRKKLWTAPSRFQLSRKEYQALFPDDAYGRESDISTWQKNKEVWSMEFSLPGKDNLQVKNLKDLKPGAYLIELRAIHKGQDVIEQRYFTLFDSQSSKLPYPQAEWFVPIKTECQPGEEAVIILGSSYKNVSLLYEVEKNHQIVERRLLTLNGEQKRFVIPVSESDRPGFWIYFSYIYNNRAYLYSQEIRVPWTNKEIDFEYLSFRDKLLPGDTEEWRLKLKDRSGGKVSAELLASMYDASLDAFKTADWNISIYGRMGRSHNWLDRSLVNTIAFFHRDRYEAQPYPQRIFPSLYWNQLYIQPYNHIRQYKSSYELDDGVRFNASTTIMDKGLVGSSTTQYNSELFDDSPQSSQKIQIRSNFAETAFFYPELRTDEKGEVSFSFQIPDSLTRWKFRAMAISQDMKIGYTEAIAVTQKPLMVIPNSPRFLKEGDRIVFPVRVSSLDEKELAGFCKLELFDALNGKLLNVDFGLEQNKQTFKIKKGESVNLNWEIDVPSGIVAVSYRVTTTTGNFSDAEENTLPVLSNRMLVTESLPLPVSGKSNKSFIFEKFRDMADSQSLKHHRLTLEFTSNPSWYAIQALPYLMESTNESIEQMFSRFYAHSLASHIAKSNPKLRQTFDAWKMREGSTALLSNLEKNQELKSVLLQETPWSQDAENEAENKRRLGLLFDQEKLDVQSKLGISKLMAYQSTSGGWPWFQGMGESRWVTQYIVEGFGHLRQSGVTGFGYSGEDYYMLARAMEFMDKKMNEVYERIKKEEKLKDPNLGYLELQYLYARSFFKDYKIQPHYLEAYDYFLDQARKYWLSSSLYGQGLIALILHRAGDGTASARILASLKEHSVSNEELGMWWESNTRGWFWHEAPIQTQALLIETFSEAGKDDKAVNAMKTWLLKQKQTTNWKTTIATVQACNALLLKGTNWLASGSTTKVRIGGKLFDYYQASGSAPEAGTGYFKHAWTADQITPSLAEVSISNPNPAPVWGSLYWQYFENMDKISPAQTPLSLKKGLFVEKNTSSGRILVPISKDSPVRVGDKVIVRIELRSDRDMEYLHLKDMRGAGLEPVNVLSGVRWQDGVRYYESTMDTSTNFFIEYLSKGTYVFEYPLRASLAGNFSNGIATIQCMYAPEFTAHSEGIKLMIER
ncbi:MAG: alpha-2-macroglobulin family protein [Candidatus Cloacimonetes bacterium]|nr:alpha-2-macroglobulin family protein [Candidatus Cloacimonadota bacterium]